MNIIKIPYGKGNILFDTNKYENIRVLSSRDYINNSSEKETVIAALNNPIQSKTLSELCKAARKVLLITNDMTRPMPSRITIPLQIEEIKKYNKNVEITILIASGLHRAMNR
jgi:nickel-dependent lactate racemase